jgi:hypoxanthine phosphoribosyltransferase
MLDKPGRRQVDITPDYSGFQVPDVFLVGYGLDHDERFRSLPYVTTLEDARETAIKRKLG